MALTAGAPSLHVDGYAALFARHPQPTWVFDAATMQTVVANDAALTRCGYTLDELSALSALDLFVEKQGQDIASIIEQVKGGESTTQTVQLLAKSSGVQAISSTWALVEFGGRSGVMVTADSPVESQCAGRSSTLSNVDLLDLASDAIIVCDLDGKLTFWNQGATRLYGWSREDAVGAQVSEFITQDSGVAAAIESNVTGAGHWHGQLQQTAMDGRALVVNSRWTLVRDDQGKPSSILIINTDLTEAKNLEAQFLRAQRLESIGTLASGIAHDLNNILSPILMSAGLLRRTMRSPEEEKLLGMIESSADRGAGIVQQVLTFARGVDGDRVLLQPKHVVSEVSKILTQTFPRNVDVRTQMQSELWTVLGDATQLHQVLLNLAVNARDAMPNGGILNISAENFQVDHHFARTNPGAQLGDHVVVRVSDTGTGMTPDVLDKIFDPFFTTKDVGKGTGLGLATVMGIVKSHAGFLTVQSEPNVGTSFQVYLPAARQEPVTNSPAVDDDPELFGRGELVLVVDDEAAIREALVQTLQDYGYRAYTAEDGSDALALYVQRKGEIDVVLTDLAMGLMDGVSLTRSLRRFDPHAKVIVSTGHCAPEQATTLKNLGVRAFLDKPYNASKLLKAVRQTLSGEPVAVA